MTRTIPIRSREVSTIHPTTLFLLLQWTRRHLRVIISSILFLQTPRTTTLARQAIRAMISLRISTLIHHRWRQSLFIHLNNIMSASWVRNIRQSRSKRRPRRNFPPPFQPFCTYPLFSFFLFLIRILIMGCFVPDRVTYPHTPHSFTFLSNSFWSTLCILALQVWTSHPFVSRFVSPCCYSFHFYYHFPWGTTKYHFIQVLYSVRSSLLCRVLSRLQIDSFISPPLPSSSSL